MKKTNLAILGWIYDNFHPILSDVANVIYEDCWVTESTLAGIWDREYGFLIPGKVNAGQTPLFIISHAIGDSGHGYSVFQIDDRSYPDFINSHPLSDLKAYAIKCVEVLKEKERSIIKAGFTRERLGDDAYEMAIICAYNCGQGNVISSLKAGKDPNRRTYNGDYGTCVEQYRNMYWNNFIQSFQESPKEEGLKDGDPESEPIACAKAVEGQDIDSPGAHIGTVDEDPQFPAA